MTLDYIFHPRSIAVVGASDGTFNAATNIFLDNLRQFGYKGEIYPINPKSKEILGLKAYSSVHDIPGPVDHVICGIPATSTHQLLKDCIAKKVRTLHLYTAGFAEIGDEDRDKLQQKLVDTACGTDVRIIGPNCMGIYCPASGISFCFDFPKEPGPVGFISQSGSYSLLVVRGAASRGVRFSKMVSYGNACDIDECDLLEYLTDDPETEVIAAYIEGTKDGQRLKKVLARAAANKPVIIIKKGGTKAGTRGASSHTGAMAGDDTVWDALIKQTGAIRVEDLEEMIDLLVTFQFFPLPRGRNAVVIGLGGGPSVRAADECERGGLTLPPIPYEMVKELRRTAPTAGSMLRNPVDVGAYHIDWNPVIQTLTNWTETDMFIWQIATDIEPFKEEGFLHQYCIDRRAYFLQEFIQAGKPLAVVVHTAESRLALETLNTTRETCVQHKVPFYTSVYKAALAISRYMDWHAKRNQKAE
jgi:acyl-CoA synthetase (NDP forming)